MTYKNTLQRRLARSKAIRRAMRSVFVNGTGAPDRRERNALFYEIAEDIITRFSDNQCRDLCSLFLQAADLTEAERKELLKILYSR